MSDLIRVSRQIRPLQLVLVLACSLTTACQRESPGLDLPIAAYRDRMLAAHEQEPAPDTVVREGAIARHGPRAQPVPTQAQLPERESLLTQPAVSTQPALLDILREVPDPAHAREVLAMRVEQLRREQEARQDQRLLRNFERVAEQTNQYLSKVALRKQVPLSLSECIQRALENNYTIRVEAHNPAIEQTRIVEAEARFDAEFYLDFNWSHQDQATISSFVPGTSDTRGLRGGIRQLLPSGMQTSVSLGQTRSKSDLPREFQSLNPSYDTSFIAEFRQPLLRGAGLDLNRSQIIVSRLQYEISREAFEQQVRETILAVETAYWRLMQFRRAATVSAETTSYNLITFENMKERLGHDATQVEVNNAQSNWQRSYVNYLETVRLIRDAEDRLKNLMNDNAFKLSQPVEILPTELPLVVPIAVDHFAEVRVALDRRVEIQQSRKRIDIARVNTSVAKNAILPRLDLTFQYEVTGIGSSADNSFDNLTTNRFISYAVGASFAYNFGERAARAGLRRANLQESQAVVALNQITDAIIEQVNVAVRTLMVRYEQIPPALESVQAAERNLRALQARSERIDPAFLQTELSAVEQLGSARQRLLTVLTDYNLGIVELENAKGTLLDYNNIVVADAYPAK